MAVTQVYVFNVGDEKIRSAVATDGETVQVLRAGQPRDSEINAELSEDYTQKMKEVLEADLGYEPIEAAVRGVVALITDGDEFPDFDAAADAAQELFDRDAVADEFAV